MPPSEPPRRGRSMRSEPPQRPRRRWHWRKITLAFGSTAVALLLWAAEGTRDALIYNFLGDPGSLLKRFAAPEPEDGLPVDPKRMTAPMTAPAPITETGSIDEGERPTRPVSRKRTRTSSEPSIVRFFYDVGEAVDRAFGFRR